MDPKQSPKPKENIPNVIKRPSLEEILNHAEQFWNRVGILTGFPSQSSYLAYIKDFYINKISKLTDEEYQAYVTAQQQDTIKRLKTIEGYIEKRLHDKQNKVD